VNLSGIDWVIVGGESGAGARPLRKEWVISIRDQCDRAKVPFFFKQWGGVRKSKGGRDLNGQMYNDMPDIPFGPAMEQSERQSAIQELAQTAREVLCEAQFSRTNALSR
jgi:hypothetical protein